LQKGRGAVATPAAFFYNKEDEVPLSGGALKKETT